MVRIAGGAIVAIAVTACGRFDFRTLTSGPGPDGGDRADDAAPFDAPVSDASPPCTFTPFSTPTTDTTLNSSDVEWGPSMSRDLLTIYYSTHPLAGNAALVTSSRATIGGAWSTPTAVVGNSGAIQGDDPFISRDGLTLFYDASGIQSITRATVASPWAAPSLVAGDTSDYTDPGGPELAMDDLDIICSAHYTADSGTYHLLAASRASVTDPFDAGVELPGLATAAGEAFPTITGDGLEIFFQRSDSTAGLFHATRATTADDFGTPTRLTELDDAGDDKVDADISADGTTLVFSSDRAGGLGSYDLWFATRTCM